MMNNFKERFLDQTNKYLSERRQIMSQHDIDMSLLKKQLHRKQKKKPRDSNTQAE